MGGTAATMFANCLARRRVANSETMAWLTPIRERATRTETTIDGAA